MEMVTTFHRFLVFCLKFYFTFCADERKTTTVSFISTSNYSYIIVRTEILSGYGNVINFVPCEI